MRVIGHKINHDNQAENATFFMNKMTLFIPIYHAVQCRLGSCVSNATISGNQQRPTETYAAVRTTKTRQRTHSVAYP